MDYTIKQLTEEDWSNFDLNIEKLEDFEGENHEDEILYEDHLDSGDYEQKNVKQEDERY